jgi:hypothetical protein
MRSVFCLVAIALCAMSSASPAQTIRGTLLDDKTERPIELASVLMRDSASFVVASATTDSAGNFVLRAPRPGSYTLLARRIGYRTDVSPALTLGENQTLEMDFLIAVRPVALAPVTVTEEQRRARRDLIAGLDPRSLGSRLITPEKIEVLAARTGSVAEVLRWQNIPGLWITDDGLGTTCLKILRGRVSGNGVGSISRQSGQESSVEGVRPSNTPQGEDDRGCMAMYLDDAVFTNLDDLDPAQIDRMLLLMPDEAGGLFGTGSSKGVLLIYSKGLIR